MKPGVSIEQLHLKGDLSQKQAFLASLDQQSWPGEDGNSLYFVRCLQVKGPWWQLGEKAAEQARRVVAEAVHGSQPAAANAEYVYFNSEAEASAYFIRDIISARPLAWYWLAGNDVAAESSANTGADKSVLILQRLKNAILELPQIASYLDSWYLLQRVFSSLRASQVKDLLYSVSVATGWKTFDLTSRQLAKDTTAQLEVINTINNEAPAWFKEALNKYQWLQQIVQQQDDFQHLYLFTLLQAWKHNSELLLSEGQFNTLIAYARQYFIECQASSQAKHPGQSERGKQVSSESVDCFGSAGAGASENSREISKNSIAVKELTHSNQQNNNTGLVLHDLECLSSHASLFFGLNIIRQSDLPKKIPAEISFIEAFYLWLNTLGINLDKGAKQVFMHLLNLEHTRELSDIKFSDIKLPDIKHTDISYVVPEHLARRYESFDFWPTAWSNIPGLIRVNDSHIDVDFHIDSIDLNIRLAGLDVDPGWIPEIGRVVKFHYGRDEALQKERFP